MKLTMAVDYYDLIWKCDGLFDEEHINRFLGECAAHGVDSVQWRLSVCGKLLYRTRTGDMLGDTPREDWQGARTQHAINEKAKAILAKFDPLEAAVRLAHKHGLKILPWLTLYDDGGYFKFSRSSLVDAHPELCWRSRDGKRHYRGVTSYVHPEVVEFRMRQIKEALNYGGDGLHLCLRTHSRPPEYFDALDTFLRDNPGSDHDDWLRTLGDKVSAMIRAAAGAYGFDPPATAAYERLTGKAPESGDLEWWRFRGQYFLDFMWKARRATPGALTFGVRYASGAPYPYGDHFFDWRALLDGIVDELHYELGEQGEACPELGAPSPAAKLGWCWLGHHGLDQTMRLKAEPIKRRLDDGSLDGVVLFEAYHFLEKPDYWSLPGYFARG